MTSPPSEAPDPILVPPASLDGIALQLSQPKNQAAAILIDDAVAITQEASPPPKTSAPSAAAPTANFFHVARAGETVNALAQRYAVDADALARINGVAKTTPLPNDTLLLLPRPLDSVGTAPDVTTYTVVAGDTYSKIARAYKLSTAALMYLNKAQSSNLKVGDTLYVPKRPR
ncbi:MAG: LysM peptidoglycan-binding domain-containing protein [bacterium]|nr:LysM peptidoglycan-binding domain-containing protein [bacterium]